MKPVHVCVPVLRRYDLLNRLLVSLNGGSLRPTKVYVIDNGRDAVKAVAALVPGLETEIVTPPHAWGVAASWNWFLRNVPEERFIVNDDIEVGSDSLRLMTEHPADFVSCGFGFSCFLIRDACVAKVGEFDETISPGYAYFEDRDYYNRMGEAGLIDGSVLCGVRHGHSQTLEACSSEERDEHNRKFVIAQENFLTKWGELPADLQRQRA